MAQRVSVALDDDLGGGPADETVRFGVGTTEYEIDLNHKNAAKLRARLAPFVGHARRVGRGQPRRAARTGASRQHSADVRAWAVGQGITISERGRIPASVTAQYEAASAGR
jgi:nucleoid-associated protein Lsr2